MPDVVVVGAGVVGASVAWHLAREGVREVNPHVRAEGLAGAAFCPG